MKICLLNDSFPPLIDGVATTVLNYANVLSEYWKDEVIVATPRYPRADYSKYPFEVLPYQSINTRKVTAGYRMGNAYSPEALLRLREFRPDIIHSHCPFSSLLLARHIHLLTGAPVVFTYHTKFDVDIKRAARFRTITDAIVKGMCTFIDSASDEVWTVSKGAGESLTELGYKGDWRIMYNGVDFPKGKADEEAVRKATSAFDLPNDVPLFLFVGRLFVYKGLNIILDALKILKDKGFDFRMIFIGEGGDVEYLKKRNVELNLQDKVRFIGRVSDRELLRAWYTRANLFLFPSTYDTNGIVVREAAAAGLASVLIRNSCAAEGVTEGRNGYLIDENAESLAETLLKIGNDITGLNAAGDKAMDELYLSWLDAVTIARENYKRILNIEDPD